MANTQNIVKEEIRAKAKALNLDAFTSREFFREKAVQDFFRGQSSETPETNGVIRANFNEFLDSEIGELYLEMENKVNTLITDELVSSIATFNNLQKQRDGLQEEIRVLERSKLYVDNKGNVTGQMELMEIDIQIDAKKTELEAVQKAYIQAYKAGLGNTTLPGDLWVLANEIANIRNEYLDEINKEMEILQTKSIALSKLSNRISLLDDLKAMIAERLGDANNMVDIAISSSEQQIPFIQAQVK